MRLQRTITLLLAVGGIVGFAGAASAATCNSTLGPITTTATVTGNTCGNNANFNGGTWCNGVPFSSTGTDAWAIQLGAAQSFTVSVTSTGAGAGAFSPDVGVIATCADNGSCVSENTLDTQGPVTVPATGNITGNAAGTYFIIVTDSSGVGSGCGAYSMSFTGTLPVKLQDFSVK
jgi:hypothetical protein